MLSIALPRRLRLPALALMALASLSPIGAAVVHVDGTTGNDAANGTAWGSAVRTIHRAVQLAAAGDSIFVREGTYSISSPVTINKALSVYGGFAGTETSPAQRSLTENTTIVDGNNAVIHVFHFDSTTGTLDGFTARGGFANGTGTGTVGGGFLGYGSTLTVRNCTFRNNASTLGGGGFDTWLCQLTVDNCVFELNTSVAGGGMRLRETTATIHRARFVSNVGSGKGGGAYFWNSDVFVSECDFTGNSTATGGGICATGGTLSVETSVFHRNNATAQSGGIHALTCKITAVDLVLRENTGRYGGGVSVSSPLDGSWIRACELAANSGDRGGAFYVDNARSMKIENCLVTGNTGASLGGAFHVRNSQLGLTHCSVTQNVSTRGAGILADSTSTITIQNSIFWQNNVTSTRADYIATKELSIGTFVVSQSDIDQNGFAGTNGNIRLDPLFVAPGHVDNKGTPADRTDDIWIDGDYSLAEGSPCVDAGVQIPDVLFDLAGTPRVAGAAPDMGALERGGADTLAPTLVSFAASPAVLTFTFSEAVAPESVLPSCLVSSPTIVVQTISVLGSQMTLGVGHPVDGSYAWTLQGITDLAGNAMTPAAGSYIIDTTAPVFAGPIITDATPTSVLVSWSAAFDASGVAAYEVSRDGSVLGQTATTTWLDSGLSPDTTYSYAITAIDAFGNRGITTVAATTLPAPTYTLGLQVFGSGYVDISPLQASYVYGTNVTLTALPDAGHQLDHWSGAATGAASTVTITIQGDTSVAAYFVAQATGVSPEGLTGHWTFDEGTGSSTWDLSGSGSHGVLMAGASWTTGISGSAASFDGVDDFIDVGTSTFGWTDACTVSFWFKATTAGGRRMVLFQRGPYVSPVIVNLESSRRIRAGVRLQTGVVYSLSTAQVNAGSWYHVAVTWVNGQTTIYVNGVADATGAAPGASLSGSGSLLTTVGLNPLGGSGFPGAIDELRLYRRALTPAEVLWLAQNGK